MSAVRQYSHIRHMERHSRITANTLGNNPSKYDVGRTICPACTGAPSTPDSPGKFHGVKITVSAFCFIGYENGNLT